MRIGILNAAVPTIAHVQVNDRDRRGPGAAARGIGYIRGILETPESIQ